MDSGISKIEERGGRDATHRARKVDTHPTHGCIEDFCGFWSARIARSCDSVVRNPGFLPFVKRAQSARGGR